MERFLKLIHHIVFNKTSGSIYLRIYAIDCLRCKESIKLTKSNVRIIKMVTRATTEVIMEEAINLIVTKLKSLRLNTSLMEEV